MQNLMRGARGADVMFLQCVLNKRGAAPRLAVDGDFGPRTQAAVTTFQSAHGVQPANGQAGASFWARIHPIRERRHAVTLFGQPTNQTCWSAAATMMTGSRMSVGQGRAQTAAAGGLRTPIDNVETFVQGMGWRIVNRQSSPSPDVLVQALNHGPVWVAFVGQHLAHAVVFGGYYYDNDASGNGCVFIVHDPWPPGRGTVYGTPYENREVILRSVASRPRAMIQFAAA